MRIDGGAEHLPKVDSHISTGAADTSEPTAMASLLFFDVCREITVKSSVGNANSQLLDTMIFIHCCLWLVIFCVIS